MLVRPFTIDVAPDEIEDLRERLDRTRWPAQLPDARWDYGVNVGYLRELCEYWRTGYDWYAAQTRLNALPQYLSEVDKIEVHYLHLPSTRADAFPLLCSTAGLGRSGSS